MANLLCLTNQIPRGLPRGHSFFMGVFSIFKSDGQVVNFYDKEIQKHIETVLGQHSDTVLHSTIPFEIMIKREFVRYVIHVLHSTIPFEMGWDIGGGADVYVYKNVINGEAYLTADLIGKKQGKNTIGNYELMICLPERQDWGVNLISNLAYYTIEASLNSGETMDLGGNFLLEDSDITALIFSKYADFKVKRKKYGILLVIGITSEELNWAKENGGEELILKLKEKGVYPMTDLKRKSIIH